MYKPTNFIPLSVKVDSFSKLGKYLSALSEQEISDLTTRASAENRWFTSESVGLALKNLAIMLENENLNIFVQKYDTLSAQREVKTVGVVMAGNIPAVGFHDAFCVLLSGHKLLAKLSKDDTVLMRFLLEKLLEIAPEFASFVQYADRMKEMDAVICTGSDNSARYFDYYFGKYPHIIRKNRTSIAVLDGNESLAELELLAKDVFSYYGLGCRNVSKIMIPESMDVTKVIEAFEPYSHIIDHHKYANNYTYNRAVLLLNNEVFLDNGFLLFRETNDLHSPLSVLYYARYAQKKELLEYLDTHKQHIQCVVSNLTEIATRVQFGKTQSPLFLDYADGVDTMAFLLGL
jgi:hypothetical protein